jgi:coproporphyrinogen III oxidase-like Fe-S oxidoreductase
MVIKEKPRYPGVKESGSAHHNPNFSPLTEERVGYFDPYFPPAEHWLGSAKSLNLGDVLSKSDIRQIDTIYFHFPFCLSRCQVCPYIKSDNKHISGHTERAINEIGLNKRYIGKRIPVNSVLLGGGTPNFLDLSKFRKIIASLINNFDFSNAQQIAIELHPGLETRAYIDTLIKSFGAERIHVSLGLQSGSDKGVKYWRKPFDGEPGLYYSQEDVKRIIRRCHSRGISEINLDFLLKDAGSLLNEEDAIKSYVNDFGVNKLTLYPVYSKFLGRDFKTRWSFSDIIRIRNESLRLMQELDFKPVIWPNYFVKTGSRPNLESLSMMRGQTVLAIGPSARGTIRSGKFMFFYRNRPDYDAYRHDVDNGILPAETVYPYPKGLDLEVGDDLRGMFVNWKSGIGNRTLKTVLDMCSDSKRAEDIRKISKKFFIKSGDRLKFKKEGFLLMDCIYWAFYDAMKDRLPERE